MDTNLQILTDIMEVILGNNRNFSRANFTIDALVNQADKTIKGEVKNVSLQGLFFETVEALDPDLPLDLSIHLSGSSPEMVIKATGSVIRVEETGIGIKFDKIDVDSFVHLRNIVSYQCGDGDKVIGEFFNYFGSNGKNG